MKEKLVSFFFNSVSIIVWAVTIVVVFTALFMLCTGMEKAPVFTLESADLSPADAAALAENGREGEDWYALTLTMRVAASDRSPFTYTADGFSLASETLPEEAFITVDPPVQEFSRAFPAAYVLTCYAHSPEGAEALALKLQSLSFRMDGCTGRFTFLKFPLRKVSPGFSLADLGAQITVTQQAQTP